LTASLRAWGSRVQASVNPKAETVEELLSRRKNLHLGMLKLAREDLAIHLQAGIDACKVPQIPTPRPCFLLPNPAGASGPGARVTRG
jgi:hypothetical protein